MKKLALFLAVFAALSCAQVQAATAPVTPAPSTAAPAPAAAAAATSAQESKMKQCAAAYHARKIEKSQYRAFMSACLKKGADPTRVAIPTATVAAPAAAPTAAVAAAPAAAASQTSKMTACNANAKTQNLTGDARKAFMKTCLSN